MKYQIPEHLPRKLTISLWDFSWYTMTMPGEPFEDLDRAFAEAVERGYNTVRICAMPFLLFGSSEVDTSTLHFTNLGGDFGQRTRWYSARGGAILNGREHLLHLFKAAQRHHCYIILSSWEYQQSPSFLASSAWYDALQTIPPQKRFMALAHAMSDLISFLQEHKLEDRIAYAELHNELEIGKLTEVQKDGINAITAMKPYTEEAIARLRTQHPEILFTACYGAPPVTHMRHLPENLQVAHFHLYIYGVLRQLCEKIGQWSQKEPFPDDFTRSILRSDAPPYEEWRPRQGESWRLSATGVGHRLFYLHDWADPDKWDLYLYEHYAAYRVAMLQGITTRLEVVADWAQQHRIPAVLGEGYVGYTPLLTNFEEGPVGKNIAEHAIQTCIDLDFWGIILCSNAAPHHPFWQDVSWQKRMNARILG